MYTVTNARPPAENNSNVTGTILRVSATCYLSVPERNIMTFSETSCDNRKETYF